MIELTDLERQIAKILVSKTKEQITYGDLARSLNPPQDEHDQKFHEMLGNVSCKCHELGGLPLLSANVVYKGGGIGPGFYKKLYCVIFPEAKRRDPIEVWVSEMNKIAAHEDWTPLLDYLGEFDSDEIDLPQGEIRLVPMSPVEFGNDSIEKVQTDYFQQELPYEKNHEYGYAERGINCGKGALLLFQLHNKVIASALFESIDKDERYIRLISGSIIVFEPITKDELMKIDDSFKGFTRTKQHLNPNCKEKLLNLINRRKYYLNPQDFGEASVATSTECDQIVKARIGQAGFRKDLLDLHGKCLICGLDLQPILRASHIKPWRDSDSKERLDKYNGLLLCPTHDALFDEGYISFDDDGCILISPQISKSMYDIVGINENIRIKMYSQNSKYLKWHRKHMKA